MYQVLMVSRAERNQEKQTLNEKQRLQAKRGWMYQVVDADTGKQPKNMCLTRKGRDLQVQVENQVVLVLEDFYTDKPAVGDAPTYFVDSSCNIHDPVVLVTEAARGEGQDAGQAGWRFIDQASEQVRGIGSEEQVIWEQLDMYPAIAAPMFKPELLVAVGGGLVALHNLGDQVKKLDPNGALDLTDASDTGASPTDSNTADNTPSLTIGTLPAGISDAVLYVDGQPVPAHYDAATGTLTPDSPIPDGPHQFSYGYTDTAGNTGSASAPLDVVIDTTPPAAPTGAPGLVNASNTADNTPSLTIGTLPAGISDAVLYVDGQPVPAHYDAASGTLTPDSPIPDGPHQFSYGYTDTAGNTGSASAPLDVVIDTTRLTRWLVAQWT